MSFSVKSGKVKTVWLPMTASTTVAQGTLMKVTSGKLVAAVAATASADVLGILDKEIAATDADYADAGRLVPVIVPLEKHVSYEGDVTSGLVAADIGKEVDLTSGTHVNRAASAVKVVKATKVLSTTKGEFFIKINGSY